MHIGGQSDKPESKAWSLVNLARYYNWIGEIEKTLEEAFHIGDPEIIYNAQINLGPNYLAMAHLAKSRLLSRRRPGLTRASLGNALALSLEMGTGLLPTGYAGFK